MTFEEIRKVLIGGHLYHNGTNMGRIDNVETMENGTYVVVIDDINSQYFFEKSEILRMIEGDEIQENRIWGDRHRIEISGSKRIKKLTSEFGDFVSLVEQMRKAQRGYFESLGLTAPSEMESLELEVDSFIEGWNKRMAKKEKGEMNYDNR